MIKFDNHAHFKKLNSTENFSRFLINIFSWSKYFTINKQRHLIDS